MRAALEFDLPDESDDYRASVDGPAWRALVEDIDNQCRNWVKHGHQFATPEELAEAIRETIREGRPGSDYAWR